MPAPVKSKQRVLTIVLTILGCLLITFFGLRAFHAFKKFNGHRPPPGQVETDVELIRDWMTVPFIARMYAVPEKIIFDALEILPRENRDKSLEEINREYYPETDGLAMQIVKAAILAHQPPPKAASPPAPFPSPTPAAP